MVEDPNIISKKPHIDCKDSPPYIINGPIRKISNNLINCDFAPLVLYHPIIKPNNISKYTIFMFYI